VKREEIELVARTKDVVTLILGGGRGSRLRPLTSYRAKPAVPIGGKYRLIDIPISNSLNSGLSSILILTQFQSHSLHRHILATYSYDRFSGRIVEILAAEQTEETSDWFQGTADAVWKHRVRWALPNYRDVLILSGDQLYRMDYGQMIRTHRQAKADMTLAAYPVVREHAPAFGLLRVNAANEIVEFVEKPTDERVIESLRLSPEQLASLGVADPARGWLASMGIYVFRQSVLFEALQEKSNVDFGKDLVPSLVGKRKLIVHPFTGYWEDIGTTRAFFEANIKLTSNPANFSFHHATFPIFTHPRALEGSIIGDATLKETIVAEGSRIGRATIEQAVIGIRSIVGDGARLKRVVLMGADYYEESQGGSYGVPRGCPPIGIGENAVIENAIVDKNARIGAGAVITNVEGKQEAEGQGYVIHDGVVVIPKDAVIPPGARI
jgi:glucose-1-phosphate adenylyltransferase